jgi:hypothetical protein
MTGSRALPALLLLSVLVPDARGAETPKKDTAGAEAQYRVARRLVAEGSAEAGPALRRVVELDPGGPLADDALIEQATLLGIAAWPEELGRIDRQAQQGAQALLQDLIDRFPESERAPEARLRTALLLLEPLAGRDATRARVGLLGVATADASGSSGSQARYAVAWLDEIEGLEDRAASGFVRILIDAPESAAAGRARVGLSRVLMREGSFERAAALLQEVADDGSDLLDAMALRETAVRGVLRSIGTSGSWGARPPRSVGVDVRASAGIAVSPRGVLVADGRAESITELDAEGKTTGRWSLADVRAITAGPLGRVFAADGGQVFRLGDRGFVPVAEQGKLAPVAALAADAAGRLWLLDDGGESIGRLDPGATSPTLVVENRDVDLTALVWDGRRLLAADARSGRILEVAPAGKLTPVGTATFKKPLLLSADSIGQVAVLDSKTDEVVLLGPKGEVRDRISTRASGIPRPSAVALGLDGSLRIVDEDSATLKVTP